MKEKCLEKQGKKPMSEKEYEYNQSNFGFLKHLRNALAISF